MMKTLRVSLGERSYPIYIGDDILSQAALLTQHIQSKEVLVVTNTTIAPLYLQSVLDLLTEYRSESVILPDGEEFKNLEVLNQVFDKLLQSNHAKNN